MLNLKGNKNLLDHEFYRNLTKEEYERASSSTYQIIKKLFPGSSDREHMEKTGMVVATVDGSQTIRGNDYTRFLMKVVESPFRKRNYYIQSYMVGDVIAMTLDEYSCNFKGDTKGLVKAEVYFYVNGQFHNKIANNGNRAFVWAQALANELQQEEEKRFLNSLD